MIFSSLQYLIFLPIVVFLYWRTTGALRIALVVAASYFFYMSWLPVYGILLFSLTLANWLLGLGMGWAHDKSKNYRQLFLGLGLLLNLGCLCYYKYTNFLLANIIAALHWTHNDFQISLLNIILPLGISFFVFEFIHYLIDIYKGDKPIKSLMKFAAFAAFFPSQIAGPIKRYQDFMEKLIQPEKWSNTLFYEAMTLILQGMFKKVAIADPIAYVITPGFAANHALSSGDALICSFGFVIQLYCDFSGYTDIGRGSALLLGIRLPENFHLPLLALSVGDFWKRWHISLSTWLRDYLYFPLGGGRGSTIFVWRNLMITMALGGLWHGAAWHYVIWGATQGVGLIVNRIWDALVASSTASGAAFSKLITNTTSSLTAKLVAWVLTFTFIMITLTIFRASDMHNAFSIIASYFNFSGECTLYESVLKAGAIQISTMYLIVWMLRAAITKRNFLPAFIWQPGKGLAAPVRFATWTAAILLMVAAKPIETTPFIYFQF